MNNQRGRGQKRDSRRPPGPRLAWAVLVVAALWLIPGPAPGRTRTAFPDKIKVSGQQLTLVGWGRRLGFFNTHYLVGLYLLRRPKVDKAVFKPDEIKQLRIKFVAGGIGRAQFLDGLNEGLFDNNPPTTLRQVTPDVKKFLGYLAEIKTARPGRLVLTYVPRQGTTIQYNGRKLGVIKGPQFMRALFAVWLGENPVNAPLKSRLLGVKP